MGVKVELFSNQDCLESFPRCMKIALISLLYIYVRILLWEMDPQLDFYHKTSVLDKNGNDGVGFPIRDQSVDDN